MSESDEKASYIDLLEEQLAKAEEEIGLLRMEAEHEAIQRDHELAWYMESIVQLGVMWNRNLDKQSGFLETELELMEEYAAVIASYVAYFEKHPNNYMSDELSKITQRAKEALAR